MVQKGDDMGFEQDIRSKGFDEEQPPLLTFYVSFVSEAKADKSKFMGAALVEAPRSTEGIRRGGQA
jgi:hypothetical protein